MSIVTSQNRLRTAVSIALSALILVGAGCAKSPEKMAAQPEVPAADGQVVVQQESMEKPIETEVSSETMVKGEGDVIMKKEEPKAESEMKKEEVSAPRVIKVLAKNWVFEPAEIRVKKGERVVLEITSVDVDHGLAIPAFNVNVKLAPNKMAKAEFTADKAGSYPFFCSVFCGSGHRDMKGMLIVE
jgi:cytochrome c oxidase subunit 2